MVMASKKMEFNTVDRLVRRQRALGEELTRFRDQE